MRSFLLIVYRIIKISGIKTAINPNPFIVAMPKKRMVVAIGRSSPINHNM
jgi:hypothetical protein